MPLLVRHCVLAAVLAISAAGAARSAEPVDAYRRAYLDECRAADTEPYCACMTAAMAVEALAIKNGPYKMLQLASQDGVEALMLDVNREILSRVHNKAPVSLTLTHDAMSYALEKHGIKADVDTMVRLNDDAFGRSALTCGG